MNATKSHEGRYGCSASNGIEPDLWSEFDISIEGNFSYNNDLFGYWRFFVSNILFVK